MHLKDTKLKAKAPAPPETEIKVHKEKRPAPEPPNDSRVSSKNSSSSNNLNRISCDSVELSTEEHESSHVIESGEYPLDIIKTPSNSNLNDDLLLTRRNESSPSDPRGPTNDESPISQEISSPHRTNEVCDNFTSHTSTDDGEQFIHPVTQSEPSEFKVSHSHVKQMGDDHVFSRADEAPKELCKWVSRESLEQRITIDDEDDDRNDVVFGEVTISSHSTIIDENCDNSHVSIVSIDNGKNIAIKTGLQRESLEEKPSVGSKLNGERDGLESTNIGTKNTVNSEFTPSKLPVLRDSKDLEESKDDINAKITNETLCRSISSSSSSATIASKYETSDASTSSIHNKSPCKEIIHVGGESNGNMHQYLDDDISLRTMSSESSNSGQRIKVNLKMLPDNESNVCFKKSFDEDKLIQSPTISPSKVGVEDDYDKERRKKGPIIGYNKERDVRAVPSQSVLNGKMPKYCHSFERPRSKEDDVGSCASYASTNSGKEADQMISRRRKDKVGSNHITSDSTGRLESPSFDAMITVQTVVDPIRLISVAYICFSIQLHDSIDLILMREECMFGGCMIGWANRRYQITLLNDFSSSFSRSISMPSPRVIP